MANGKSEEPADFPYIIFHLPFFIAKTGYLQILVLELRWSPGNLEVRWPQGNRRRSVKMKNETDIWQMENLKSRPDFPYIIFHLPFFIAKTGYLQILVLELRWPPGNLELRWLPGNRRRSVKMKNEN
ncbi:MAG TPA: hypothetical protein VN643_23105 [Pyrinomonadaceae bacterium]|nr:hypothetical protein [Pyrinomonadaceae bacterium]